MSNKFGARALLASILFLTAALSFIAAGCSSTGGGVGGPLSRVIGRALAPENDGNQDKLVPLPDATIVLVEFNEDGSVKRTQVGMTDADGNFVVNVNAQPVIAVVINGETNDGEVEVSGLYNPDLETIEKDLDPATSVACIAGITAVVDGSITDEQLNESRVQNLEDASVDYIAANPDFDFYNSDDVDAAVAAVRAATNDGANPAAPGAFT